ncbi:MAG: ABC transporter permease [Spirochaetae bacterium HGW-Spirochaetae-2]|jgi:tripartite ATP-independent transporter DctM subunit|nr:MAG: ABC transporter permease [Spirochaetae bacterium HGW-Spirochaetae-2]
MVTAVLLIFFFGTIFTKLPVAIVLGFSALASIMVQGTIPMTVIVSRMFAGLDSYTLIAIPMFILAGNLLNESGATTRLFDFADTLVGRFRGGLGHTNILASVLFAGLSGSAVADSAGLGRIEIESMEGKGYPIDYAAAITVSSAVIGPIIPPSIPMIVFGAMAGESVIKLFAGGIIPGLLTAFMLMIAVFITSKWIPNFPAPFHASLGQIWHAFKRGILALIAPIIILGGIFSGLYTPTEASVMTVFYVLAIEVFVYRQMKIADYKRIMLQTIIDTGAVVLIISMANAFGWVLAIQRIPNMLTVGLESLNVHPYVILMLINIILLFLGCFVEGLAVMAILIPVLVPLIQQLGLSTVHFGVLMVFNLMLGTVTPPLGMSLFVISNITKLSVGKIARATVPFFIPLIITLVIITLFPQLVLFIPNLL